MSNSKIALKNVKYMASLSEETYCFTATLYVDGKKAGTAENRGNGGETSIYWTDKELGKQAEAWAEKQPDITCDDLPDPHDSSKPFSYSFCLPSHIDELMTDWLIESDLKKALAGRILYTKKDGQIYQTKKLSKTRLAQYLAMGDIGLQLGAENILNKMPIGEALKIYRQAA